MAPQFRSTLAVKFVTTEHNWLRDTAQCCPLASATPRVPAPAPSRAIALQTCLVARAHLITQSSFCSLACPLNPNTILRIYQSLVRDLVNVKLYYFPYFSKSMELPFQVRLTTLTLRWKKSASQSPPCVTVPASLNNALKPSLFA